MLDTVRSAKRLVRKWTPHLIAGACQGSPAGARWLASPPPKRTWQTAVAALPHPTRTGDTCLLRRRSSVSGGPEGFRAGQIQGAPVVGRKSQGSRRRSGRLIPSTFRSSGGITPKRYAPVTAAEDGFKETAVVCNALRTSGCRSAPVDVPKPGTREKGYSVLHAPPTQSFSSNTRTCVIAQDVNSVYSDTKLNRCLAKKGHSRPSGLAVLKEWLQLAHYGQHLQQPHL